MQRPRSQPCTPPCRQPPLSSRPSACARIHRTRTTGRRVDTCSTALRGSQRTALAWQGRTSTRVGKRGR
eukprot:2701570-Rhodomonas_salina.2